MASGGKWGDAGKDRSRSDYSRRYGDDSGKNRFAHGRDDRGESSKGNFSRHHSDDSGKGEFHHGREDCGVRGKGDFGRHYSKDGGKDHGKGELGRHRGRHRGEDDYADHKESRRGRHHGDELPTLPVVLDHMRDLLRLPDACRAACSACSVYRYTVDCPAPVLPPLAHEPADTLFASVELDTFAAAAALRKNGWPKPAVLNMANEHNCGGAWCQKPGSQEEDLLRCSSLPLSLWPRRLPSDHRMPEFDDALPRDEAIYPFTEACVVYTPTVLVCRSRKGEPLPPSEQFEVSALSSAAQDLRDWKPHYTGPFDANLSWEKMRSHLWAAAHHGHTAVVLGAYGCGAFKHDPWRTAKLYWKLLGPGGEFEGRFQAVVFAIIKSPGNLEAFSSNFPWARSVPHVAASAQRQHPAPAAVAETTSQLTDSEKDALKLAKKLREVLKLEDSIAAGTTIAEENQKQKLLHKQEWWDSLTVMMDSLPSESGVRKKVRDVLQRGL